MLRHVIFSALFLVLCACTLRLPQTKTLRLKANGPLLQDSSALDALSCFFVDISATGFAASKTPNLIRDCAGSYKVYTTSSPVLKSDLLARSDGSGGIEITNVLVPVDKKFTIKIYGVKRGTACPTTTTLASESLFSLDQEIPNIYLVGETTAKISEENKEEITATVTSTYKTTDVSLTAGCKDKWFLTSTDNAPVERYNPSAVWTGSKMIVWGGTPTWGAYTNTGGMYDPATDTWTATSLQNSPEARTYHTAVWTGSKMIIWGGDRPLALGAINTGGVFDPVANTWTATSQQDAPLQRSYHSAIWTGTEMVVWGGLAGVGQTGGRYNPVTDSWRATSESGAPTERFDHTAIWTGTHMIIWGDPNLTTTGGLYEPANNSWTAMSQTNAVVGYKHPAVWTGSKMIIWGGLGSEDTKPRMYTPPPNEGWTVGTSQNAPSARYDHSAVWTGSKMIIWGRTAFSQDSKLYDPVANTWTDFADSPDFPATRDYHTTVWTGSMMIVWGGAISADPDKLGAIYLPP